MNFILEKRIQKSTTETLLNIFVEVSVKSITSKAIWESQEASSSQMGK